jgi:hypothetical protein
MAPAIAGEERSKGVRFIVVNIGQRIADVSAR